VHDTPECVVGADDSRDAITVLPLLYTGTHQEQSSIISVYLYSNVYLHLCLLICDVHRLLAAPWLSMLAQIHSREAKTL